MINLNSVPTVSADRCDRQPLSTLLFVILKGVTRHAHVIAGVYRVNQMSVFCCSVADCPKHLSWKNSFFQLLYNFSRGYLILHVLGYLAWPYMPIVNGFLHPSYSLLCREHYFLESDSTFWMLSLCLCYFIVSLISLPY